MLQVQFILLTKFIRTLRHVSRFQLGLVEFYTILTKQTLTVQNTSVNCQTYLFSSVCIGRDSRFVVVSPPCRRFRRINHGESLRRYSPSAETKPSGATAAYCSYIPRANGRIKREENLRRDASSNTMRRCTK